MADKILITPAEKAEISFTERKSVFIGNASPVSSEEEALGFIAGIRKRYGDAKHNVYAYVLDSGITRSSDDGEPSGTAGVPVMQAIRNSGKTNAAVVVTRYFGGILLGAGGLVRAYTRASAEALEEAGRAVFEEYDRYGIICEYGDFGSVKYDAEKAGMRMENPVFGEKVSFSLSVKRSAGTDIPGRMRTLCREKVSCELTGTVLARSE